MIGIGAMEFLMLLVLGGGIGVPVGLPPGPEDPALAAAAPENCLFYSSWAAPATASAESGNQTEKLLAEPEVRELLADVQTRLTRELRRAAARQSDPKAKAVADFIPVLANAVLSNSGAMFVTKFDIGAAGPGAPPGPPSIEAAFVLKAGDKGAAIKTAIERFQRTMAEGVKPEAVTIGGAAFTRLQPDPRAPAIVWGLHGEYLIAAIGDGADANGVIEGALKRMKGEAPAWLQDLKSASQIERRATVAYLNLAGAKSVLGKMMGGPPAPAGAPAGASPMDRVLGAFGLADLTAMTTVTGLDETGFVSRSHLSWNKDASGLLAIGQAKPLTAEDLAPIPHDAPYALAMRLDAAQLYDIVIKAIGDVEPGAVDRLEAELSHAEAALGYDLRDDLLAALGDSWRLYADPQAGGLITGWTAVIGVRDSMRFSEMHEALLDTIAREAGPEGAASVRRLAFAGKQIHYVNVPEQGFPFTPSWCLDGDKLVLALFPQTIKSYLSRGDDFQSLATDPEVSALLGQKTAPLMIGRQDPKAILELAYPALQMLASATLAEARKNGVDLDVGMLPSAGALSKHLTPGIVAWNSSDNGWEMVRRQSAPGGGIGASAPLAVGFLLPAVQAAREAARRTQGANNLKQLGLAVHNYADTFKALPAAYSADKEGKPLLSWRVHILPYIEQDALYRRFKLDEPWDSEHNKALIPLMPQVYRDPNSRAEPGKTNYLAITGKSGIFAPPKDLAAATEFPKGIGFADITDGTSNTMLTVAASDARAVIWTKPDDFNPEDAMAPVRDLQGLNPGGFQAGFGDGSVRFISQAVDPAILDALFTRNGGEVVGGF